MSNPYGSDTLTRPGYITVTNPIRDWQMITTATTLPIVGEQAMAYDPLRGRVVLSLWRKCHRRALREQHLGI